MKCLWVLVVMLLMPIVSAGIPAAKSLAGPRPQLGKESFPDSLLNGKRVAVMTGSLGEMILSEEYPQVTVRCFDDIMDGFAALKAEKVDFVMTAFTTAYVIGRSDASYKILPYNLTNEGAGVAISRDDTTGLLAQVDSVLAVFRAKGMLDAIVGNWIRHDGSDYVITDFSATGGRGSGAPLGRPPLRVGTAANREPMCFVQNNKIVGLDWELMMRIGRALDREVEFVDMKYAALIAALQSGRIDAIASNMTATAERKQQVDFSTVYYVNPQVLIEWSENGDKAAGGLWQEFKQALQRNVLHEKRYMLILDGLWVTCLIAVLSVICGTFLGAGVCALRMSAGRLSRRFAQGYIALFRAIPHVVILMLMFYVVFATLRINGIFVSVITFAMIFAAYSSELFRSSLESIPTGQRHAGLALGFNKFQTFWHILLPQAVRIAFPVYKGEVISLIKMTAIVGYIAVQDLTKAGDIIRSRTFDAFFPLLMVALIYLVIIWAITRLLNLVSFKQS
ncbi:MAG: ABC transporter substrate-binding protein/permease [Bacteroidales bacterium]|jgi:polar amino acid transport system substrate-binding protein